MAESSMQIAVATAAAVVGVLLGGADCCGVNGRERGRLQRVRSAQEQRITAESTEEREARLQRLRDAWQQRVTSETPEQLGLRNKSRNNFFDEERLPIASTCSLILRLPRHLVEEEEFKQKMIFSILGVWFWKRLTCTFNVHYFNFGIIYYIIALKIMSCLVVVRSC